MSEGASLLRSVVERTARQYPRKAVKALFKHCFTVVVQRHRVFCPLALDTIKTLNALLEVRQHLEHLEDRQWLDLVRVALGQALGTPVRLDSGMDDDDDVFLSDSESEDIDGRESTSRSTAKTKAPKGRAATSSSSLHQGQPAQALIEAFTMLAHLTHSPNANLILLPQATALLHKFSKLFHLVIPPHASPIAEATSHLPLLQAFNGLLANVVDNASLQLSKVAPTTWLQLSRLWPGIKTTGAKEQTLIALKRLSPAIFTLSDRATSRQCCTAMIDVLTAEPASRFRIEEMSLEALSMHGQTKPRRKGRFRSLFELPTLSWAPNPSFSAGQAISWTLLQLASECLFYLFHQAEKAGAAQTGGQSDEPGPSKRRKVCKGPV